jgi:PPK2 family polyphosphate:nucleotide phosphotransferase
MKIERLIVPPGCESFRLEDRKAGDTAGLSDSKDGARRLEKNTASLGDLQERLWAQDSWGVLVILQAMDAAGKDGTIKMVMSGVNPQGCQVYGFKAPSHEELDHDFMWRYLQRLPERGRIGIFNRSYYEEVLVVRVRPELLDAQRLPAACRKDVWTRRFGDINAIERYLANNGIAVVKIFLNVSHEEQLRRLVKRLDKPNKSWKFCERDLAERALWDKYMEAYQVVLSQTSTEHAPWYVVPADHKWYTRAAVSEVVVRRLEELDPRFPEVSAERRAELQAFRKTLAEGQP